MTRIGMSFTLTILIAAMVLLATGFGLIAAYQGQMPVLSEWVSTGTEDSLSGAEIEQAKSNCELNRDQYCEGGALASDCPSMTTQREWACRAQYNNRYCYEYWEMQGGVESIPLCDE